jgi:prophage regulatory protein
LKTVKGIRFSRQHIHRLVKEKKFPAPLKLGPATNGWLEDEIDDWIDARARERKDTAIG